jgi:enoyl-CoA hydratase/carnithine racemase
MDSAMSHAPEYFSAYESFAIDRPESGVVTVRFHTNGSEHVFNGATHRDFPRLIEEIAYDRDNKVLVLTGTGNTFIDAIDGPSLGDFTKPWEADKAYVEGRRGIQRLVDLEIPIVAAVNGPVSVHSEYALLADVIVASDSAVFSDFPHLGANIAPGDGLVVVWEEVLGLNRARYLELTRGAFTAQEALAWGAVGEVVPQDQVRARELAEQMTTRPQLTNRYVAMIFRQRISRRLNEGMALGMALESLTAANLPYVS